MGVRAVEDAAVGVLPPACEEPEAHRPVGHVRRRQHELSAWPKQRAHALQEGLRIAQVLDHVSAEHDVERLLRKGELHRLDVSDEHLLADSSSLRGCMLVRVDAHDRCAALYEPTGEVAG